MDRLGMSQELAEKWAQSKIERSSTTVKNWTPYLRTCIAQELEQREAPAKTSTKGTAKGKSKAPVKKPAKGIPTAGQRAAALGRPETTKKRYEVLARDKQEVLTESRRGVSHEQIAEQLNYSIGAIDSCRQDADQKDARTAARTGAPVEQLVARYPHVPVPVLLTQVQQAEDLVANHVRRFGYRVEQLAPSYGETADAVRALLERGQARQRALANA